MAGEIEITNSFEGESPRWFEIEITNSFGGFGESPRPLRMMDLGFGGLSRWVWGSLNQGDRGIWGVREKLHNCNY